MKKTLPPARILAAALAELLADMTEHREGNPWRLRSVRLAAALLSDGDSYGFSAAETVRPGRALSGRVNLSHSGPEWAGPEWVDLFRLAHAADDLDRESRQAAARVRHAPDPETRAAFEGRAADLAARAKAAASDHAKAARAAFRGMAPADAARIKAHIAAQGAALAWVAKRNGGQA